MEKLIFEAFPDAQNQPNQKIFIPSLNITLWYRWKNTYEIIMGPTELETIAKKLGVKLCIKDEQVLIHKCVGKIWNFDKFEFNCAEKIKYKYFIYKGLIFANSYFGDQYVMIV